LRNLRMSLESIRLTYEEVEQADPESYDELLSTLESEMDEFEESLSQAREELKAA